MQTTGGLHLDLSHCSFIEARTYMWKTHTPQLHTALKVCTFHSHASMLEVYTFHFFQCLFVFRMAEIYLELGPDSAGLGISIVGGSGSPSGDLPIIIKRVLPNSTAERDGRLKSGDELIAVNDTLLVGVAKDVAIATLSNLSGNVRLLVLQDD